MTYPLKRVVTNKIKYQKGTAIQSFSGFDALPTSFTDTRVLLKYNPKFVTANVALAGTDILANNTVAKVIDLTKAEMQSRAQDLADTLGTMLWDDGTGNNSKDTLGLKAIVDDGEMKVCAVNKFDYMLEQLVKFLIGGLNPLKI